jgi:hypothetical protein
VRRLPSGVLSQAIARGLLRPDLPPARASSRKLAGRSLQHSRRRSLQICRTDMARAVPFRWGGRTALRRAGTHPSFDLPATLPLASRSRNQVPELGRTLPPSRRARCPHVRPCTHRGSARAEPQPPDRLRRSHAALPLGHSYRAMGGGEGKDRQSLLADREGKAPGRLGNRDSVLHHAANDVKGLELAWRDVDGELLAIGVTARWEHTVRAGAERDRECISLSETGASDLFAIL